MGDFAQGLLVNVALVVVHILNAVPENNSDAAIAARFLQQVGPLKALGVGRNGLFVELAGFAKTARFKFANGYVGIFVAEKIIKVSHKQGQS